jgi:hypothetical protein
MNWKLHLILLGLALANAADAAPVTDEATAISLANRACYEEWGKYEWNIKKAWHARVDGDHWTAWAGGNAINPEVTIDVLSDGTPPDPKSCEVRIYD